MTEKEAKYIKRYYCKRCRTKDPKLVIVHKSKYKEERDKEKEHQREREKRREEKKRKREERHKKEAEDAAKGTEKLSLLLPFYVFLIRIF